MMLTTEHGVGLWLIRRLNRVCYSRLASKLDYYRRYGIFVHLKFAIAKRLDKNPDYCWASLVTWALRWQYQPWYQPLTPRGRRQLKHQMCPSSDHAWCGKCEVQGRMK